MSIKYFFTTVTCVASTAKGSEAVRRTVHERTRRKATKSCDASSVGLLDEQSERRARRAREPVADTRGAALPRAAITSQKGNSLFGLQIPCAVFLLNSGRDTRITRVSAEDVEGCGSVQSA